MNYIELTQDRRVLVDDDVYEWLNGYYWHVTLGGTRKSYAVRKAALYGGFRKVYMHRLVCGFPALFDVRFISGDSLDCRADNLMVVNLSGQQEHWRGGRGCSEFLGVTWNKGRGLWEAHLNSFHVGFYDNEVDAARAYNAKALEVWGERTPLNEFPFLSRQEQRSMPSLEDKRAAHTSRYRGIVCLPNGRYLARIRVNGKRIVLGDTDDEEYARQLYDNACRQYGLMDRINV